MQVLVTKCWGNKHGFYYRLVLSDGRKTIVPGTSWNESVIAEALNRLASVYRLRSKNVRFLLGYS